MIKKNKGLVYTRNGLNSTQICGKGPEPPDLLFTAIMFTLLA
jgi:hypothetical protein